MSIPFTREDTWELITLRSPSSRCPQSLSMSQLHFAGSGLLLSDLCTWRGGQAMFHRRILLSVRLLITTTEKKRPLVVWGIQGIILYNNIAIVIEHCKDPYETTNEQIAMKQPMNRSLVVINASFTLG